MTERKPPPDAVHIRRMNISNTRGDGMTVRGGGKFFITDVDVRNVGGTGFVFDGSPPAPAQSNHFNGPAIVQQGNGNLQIVRNDIDWTLVSELISKAQDALDKEPALGERQKAAFEVELDTLSLQMKKGHPSKVIAQETGRTLRSLAEGVAAGLLTPPALSVIIALATAMGS